MCIMVYYSAIKRNDLPKHTKMWMNLECFIVSDRSLFRKKKTHIIMISHEVEALMNRISDLIKAQT